MPLEILWDDVLDKGGGEEILEVRFRRPQLIKPEDIISILNELEFFRSFPINERAVFRPVLEDEKKRPFILLPGEEYLSATKAWAFPIMCGGRGSGNPNLSVIHNVPLKEGSLMGSCTWFCYTQPLTSLKLSIDFSWFFDRKTNPDSLRAWQAANNLYWFFQSWINNGVLVNKLAEKGYDLTPQFDPTWTDCVMEDQCQQCGKIVASMPLKRDKIRVGKLSKNICHCRQRCRGQSTSAIMRRFKVIGAYPISPDEAEVARAEGMLQADSAD